MRKLATASLLLSAMIAISCNHTTPRQAAEYSDMLISHQKAIIIQYDSLLESFDTYVGKKMEHASLALSQEIDNAKFRISNIEPVKGGEEFQQAMLSFIATYEDISQNSIPDLVTIYSLPQNEFSSELKVKWDNIYKDMDNKLKNADKLLMEAQEKYANSFKLKISK